MPPKGIWIEQVDKRTRNGKKRVDSADPLHFAVDVTIGSVHYKDNPSDPQEQWKNIDSYFEPAIAPWDRQMLKAGYHIRVKEDFTAGQIIEFEKQGETDQIQPMALEWTNDLDQIQPISMPQDVSPIITNPEVDLLPAVGMPSHQGTIRWNDAYGQGIDFEWRCTSTRLIKILEIENLNKLPTPEQYILDGGNPVLRLNLIFDPSSGVDIYTDGELWDKATKKQTFKIIEFRKGSDVLWGFMPLRYWGSGTGVENRGQSVATLEKRGNKLYTSIRVPYEWLQSATYPVFIDIDVDEQISNVSDDGTALPDIDGGLLFTDGIAAGYETGINGWGHYHMFLRWRGVTISGTITAAHIEILCLGGFGSPLMRIYGVDEDNPAAPQSCAEFFADPLTDEFKDWDATFPIDDWIVSLDIKDIFQELVTAYTIENEAVMLQVKDDGSPDNNINYGYPYDSENPEYAAKLHIEYEEAAAAAYKDVATRFKLTVQAYQDIATRFKLTVQAYQDIATRFKLTVQNFQDAATRFKLSVGTVAYQDIATRFKLWVQGFQDAATRFKLIIQGFQDAATRFKLIIQGFQDAATRFRLNLGYYKDIATRFKVIAQNFQDAATRFKLWVRGYQDIATRFKLWVSGYQDAATRFRLNLGFYKDIATRFKLWATSYKDIATRFTLQVREYQDIATRFKLIVQAYQDTATRFRLNLGFYQDIATRFKLTVQSFQDTATRFKLWVRGYQDIATRFQLTVQGYQDIATRFKLRMQGFQDAATRFKLIVQGFQDTQTRFKLIVQNYRDIATRFKVTVQGYTDIATRFILIGLGYKDIATRFELSVGSYSDISGRFRLRLGAAFPIIGGGHIINIAGD